jgi:parallel beta-helix repeat protein
LSEIYNKLNNHEVLDKQPQGVWLLNAGIVIDKGASLHIDSNDTKWLKIVADGSSAYPIDVSGSLRIDSVKVTSWNTQTNSYVATNSSGSRELVGHAYKIVKGTPRPYITVEEGATGTTDITNSEIAYLGYEAGIGGGVTGLRYAGGDGSIIRGNDIHDLYFGFYSSGVGGLVIENNHVHNNGHYGLDPHTGTHDMIIRNNTVHDNGSIGIICSFNCYHITIENNKVYDNARIGIMFSRNTHDSIARNNNVNNETQCIFLSQSTNNEVYNNTVSRCSEFGIHIFDNSANNAIYYNTIIDSSKDVVLDGAGTGNNLYSNKVVGSNINPGSTLDTSDESG